MKAEKKVVRVEIAETFEAVSWEEPELIQLESCGSCGNNSGS
jgi:hypothetical protein